jgi:3-isopropylmalate/(R)-2-methylmalate dehydratase small subunit
MRAWVLGDNVDTDVLAPGRYMKFGIEEIAKHCLESVRPEFAHEVRRGDVIVAGRNFGAGSSREQAPAALKHLGVAALVAESFAGLFYRNAINLGLPAIVCNSVRHIEDGDAMTLDFDNSCITVNGKVLPFEPIPAHLRELLRDGGLLPHLEKKLARKA